MFRVGAVLDGEKYLTPQEAGVYLGVNPKTLCRWARQDRIPAIAMNESKRKMWRFQVRELDKWMVSRQNISLCRLRSDAQQLVRDLETPSVLLSEKAHDR